MRKSIKYMMLAAFSIGFVGCGGQSPTPQFSPYKKRIVFYEGVAYNMPQGAFYGGNQLRAMIKCKNTQIPWIEDKIHNFIFKSSSYEKLRDRLNQDKSLPQLPQHDQNTDWLTAINNNLKAQGLAGCVAPLTDKEYKYLTGQEKQERQFQHEQSIQNQKSLDSRALKNYNINVH